DTIIITDGTFLLNTVGKGIKSTADTTLKGGDYTINSTDDALHTNGNITIDADSSITFSGVVVMAVCSSNSMWQDITGKLSGGAVINQSVGSVSTSTVFAVKDSSDSVLSALQSKLSGSVGIVYYNGSSTASTVSTGGSYSGTLDDFGYGSGGNYTGGTSYTLSTSSSNSGGNTGPGGRF
ncbi:MAG: carbohydrate-binding domain-containing protein, partial [Ruminococcus sp.]